MWQLVLSQQACLQQPTGSTDTETRAPARRVTVSCGQSSCASHACSHTLAVYSSLITHERNYLYLLEPHALNIQQLLRKLTMALRILQGMREG